LVSSLAKSKGAKAMKSAMKGKRSLFTTVSIAALLIPLGGALAANRDQPPSTHVNSNVHRIISAVPGATTLYDQNSDDAGVSVPSTDDDYHFQGTWGADDFVVPQGHVWNITEVEVSGAYAAGPTPKKDPNLLEYVTFYTDTDGNGVPDHIIRDLGYLKGREHKGSFAIKFGPLNLKEGQYWISVSAVIDRLAYGEWEWETRSTQNNDLAAWRTNYGDPSSDCWDHYGVMNSCVDIGEGPDFMFALKGQDQLAK
jgi:hypothetical protein